MSNRTSRDIEGGPEMDKVCELPGCDALASRVMDGHDMCWQHSHYDLHPALPIVVCALDGCGIPAAAATVGSGKPLCAYHRERIA
jgi:hypothetical protein